MRKNQKILQNNIRLLRAACDISQEELAATIHLARTTYSAYETGQKDLDLQTIDSLARVYDISLDILINYDLSDGLFKRIYFTQGNEELANVLNSYQSLSVPSKHYIIQKISLLIENETSLYGRLFGLG